MERPAGNRRLKAARLAKGFGSQRALAEALNAAARDLGLRGVSIGERQVRRWESEDPPWPQSHHQQVLTHVLGLGITDLGFTPSRGAQPDGDPSRERWWRDLDDGSGSTAHIEDASSVAAECATVATARRRLYWAVDAQALHRTVVEDVKLGRQLLGAMPKPARTLLARALAESALLAGRIEFFDLRQPEDADESFVRALQFAGEAEDSLLGAAILGHAAFIPGWEGDQDGVEERLAAARAHARRGEAGPLQRAWLDAVEAECRTRSGDVNGALALISRAEAELHGDVSLAKPDWMDWFTPLRLAAFRGNVELKAHKYRRAEATLGDVLAELPSDDTKQRAVVLADLAAAKLGQKDVEVCCASLDAALDELAQLWYATAMDRIREVRRGLREWQDESCVRDLDARLYDWSNTVSAFRS